MTAALMRRSLLLAIGFAGGFTAATVSFDRIVTTAVQVIGVSVFGLFLMLVLDEREYKRSVAWDREVDRLVTRDRDAA